jgi:SH3 domain protein
MTVTKKHEHLLNPFSLLSLLIVLLAGTATAAEIKFVRPDLDIPVRRGRGEQYKIMKFVKDGNQVEFFEENGNWAKVRLQSGTEGWMLKRYLSDEKPPVEQVRELREENEQLKTGNEKLTRDLKKIKELQLAGSEELENCQRKTEEELASGLSECNKMKDEYKASQEFNKIMWFLSGAGVLLVGWLTGRFAGGSQKKRNRLL